MEHPMEKKNQGAIARVAGWAHSERYALAAAATAMALSPAMAWADTAMQLLDKIKGLLVGGVGMLGAGMVVFGAVSIGTNLHNGAQGNGAAIAGGLATLVGGVIIAVAALSFGSMSTDWVNG